MPTGFPLSKLFMCITIIPPKVIQIYKEKKIISNILDYYIVYLLDIVKFR